MALNCLRGKENLYRRDRCNYEGLHKKNEVFADAFNYFMYDGAQMIQPDQLRELDPTEIAILFNENDTQDRQSTKKEIIQKYRDHLKSAAIMEDGETAYVLLGIENQTDVNYAMPVRNMLYDALQYVRQVSRIADVHRSQKVRQNIKMQLVRSLYLVFIKMIN